MADPVRLDQVVTNLLDNAIKYSPDGGPIVVAVEPSQEAVCISVTDRGIGVPPEHREHIFDRFYTAHPGTYSSGLGLSLHMSREVVRLHGGSLEAEFPEGGGARFVVSLPRHAPVPAH